MKTKLIIGTIIIAAGIIASLMGISDTLSRAIIGIGILYSSFQFDKILAR